MLLTDLAKLRPPYLVATVLCWNAAILAVKAAVPPLPLLLLSSTSLALGVVTLCVRRTRWAPGLVVRDDIALDEVRGVLFLISFFSLVLAAWGFVTAYELEFGPRSKATIY
ncbi:hypothetical protein ACFPN2_19695 [Steroidobacter flavus]|uniref:Uncharacterized protein n=1 Tax=Steroidobacter flavus TaxID=1842136 RepID=A0ABV8SV28_9GAMM